MSPESEIDGLPSLIVRCLRHRKVSLIPGTCHQTLVLFSAHPGLDPQVQKRGEDRNQPRSLGSPRFAVLAKEASTWFSTTYLAGRRDWSPVAAVFACRAQRGQQNCQKQSDDSDDDQYLDKRKPPRWPCLMVLPDRGRECALLLLPIARRIAGTPLNLLR
jgi:hypothetical protein